jgi:repressor LexA
MGYVGAGGDIQPEYEQVSYDGLEQIEPPHPIGIVDDPVGFRVRGESMAPKYEPDAIVVVEQDQPWSTDSMIGDEAVVRTDLPLNCHPAAIRASAVSVTPLGAG